MRREKMLEKKNIYYSQMLIKFEWNIFLYRLGAFVSGDDSNVGPSEAQCRPYIEKAINELKTGEPSDGIGEYAFMYVRVCGRVLMLVNMNEPLTSVIDTHIERCVVLSGELSMIFHHDTHVLACVCIYVNRHSILPADKWSSSKPQICTPQYRICPPCHPFHFEKNKKKQIHFFHLQTMYALGFPNAIFFSWHTTKSTLKYRK